MSPNEQPLPPTLRSAACPHDCLKAELPRHGPGLFFEGLLFASVRGMLRRWRGKPRPASLPIKEQITHPRSVPPRRGPVLTDARHEWPLTGTERRVYPSSAHPILLYPAELLTKPPFSARPRATVRSAVPATMTDVSAPSYNSQKNPPDNPHARGASAHFAQ